MVESSLNTRNEGIDLLRVFSMLGIVCLHVLDKGGIIGPLLPNQAAYYVVNLLEAFVLCSVNCYALISGYVGYSRKVKFSRLICLWIEVLFYSVVIHCIFFLTKPCTVSVKAIISAFLPITFNGYWYFTAYFCMFSLSPILNFIINKCSDRLLLYTLLVSFILFSIWPTLGGNDIFITSKGYSPWWLAFLYGSGGTISKFQSGIYSKTKIRKHGFIYLLCSLCTWTLVIGVGAITFARLGAPKGKLYFIQYTSPLQVIGAVSLVKFFSLVTIKSEVLKWIGKLSKYTFGVYLIHTCKPVFEILLRERFTFLLNTNAIIITAGIILISILIFSVSAIIDKLRSIVFNNLGIPRYASKLSTVFYNFYITNEERISTIFK